MALLNFANIFRPADSKYSEANITAALINHGITLDASGNVNETRTLITPTGELIEQKSPLNTEKRWELIPNIFQPGTSLLGTPLLPKRDAERRSLPRGDRDPREVADVKDGAAPADRRTGGPLKSLLDELKIFFLKPQGMVLLSLGFVLLAVAATRKKAG